MKTKTGELDKKSLWWLVLLVSAGAVATDLVTKSWALSNLGAGQRISVVGNILTLHLVHNPGAAFSLGAEYTWVFTALTVGILAAAVWYTFKVSRVVPAVLLGLLVGGALGNLHDRLTRPPAFGRGEVVDFIDYNGFFVGNVADIWIVVAAVGFIVWQLITSKEQNPPSSPERREPSGNNVGVRQ